MPVHHYDWKPALLAALCEVPVLRHACEAAKIDRTAVWKARETDPEFAAAYDAAIEAGVDRAEQEAFRRAVVGFEEPVVHQGGLAYRMELYADEDGAAKYRPVLDPMGQPVPLTVRKHSDALLSLFLKGRRKKIYADRTELTGADGGPVVQVDETARSARVAQLLALAERRKAQQDEFGDLA